MSLTLHTIRCPRRTNANRAEGFRRHVRRCPDGIVGVFLQLFFCCLSVPAATHPDAGLPAPPTLKPVTLAAFERYVKLTESRSEAELQKGAPFFWIDDLAAAQRAEAYAALKRGEIKLRRLETLDNGAKIVCPGGLIHHWTGLVFIPGAKLDGVLNVLQDYDRHSIYYAP